MSRAHFRHSHHRQRMLGVIFSIILQFTIFVIIMNQFSQYFFLFYWICVLVSVLVSLFIATREVKLAYKVAWVVPILLFPLIGGIAYIISGGAKGATYQKEASDKIFRHNLKPAVPQEEIRRWGEDAAQQAWYLEHTALSPVYKNTETRYFPTGEGFFSTFLEDLESAKRYIFLEYFIISEGSMWDDVLEVLRRKAAQGVEIRIIYDGVGSAATLPKDYPDDLEAMGIACRVFQPFRPMLYIRQNNRDHRKICVVDGEVGYVGGLNMSDEYIARQERFGYWKDNALRLRGDAVWSLSVFFLTMWEDGNNREDYTPYRPQASTADIHTTGLVAPYADIPLFESTICADLYLQMITKAKKYIYITTPYLAIDESMTAVLANAARTGVDVRIITPRIPDKKLVFAVTRSNYPTLLKAGVRIYEFLPGFMHSKTVVMDDLCASVGSCNLDYRSLYLHFENGVWLCGDPAVIDVRKDFLQAVAVSREITLETFENVPLFRRIIWSILRLFAPVF